MRKKSRVAVKVIKGDINRALKKFKRGVMESEHLLELRERRYYKKPTTIRRRQKQLAVREQYKKTILEKIRNLFWNYDLDCTASTSRKSQNQRVWN